MQNCDECYGKRWYAKIDKKTGLQLQDNDGLLLWRCYRCGHVQTERAVSFIPTYFRTTANILYIDLEVSKSLYWNYGLDVRSGRLNPADTKQKYFIICWAATYNGKKIWGDSVTPKEVQSWNKGNPNPDERILSQLQGLMQSADIIAGHNVDRYDMKRANTRFLLTGLNPIIGKKTHDTLKIARAKFAFESNRLDDICFDLGLRGKFDVTNKDWLKIVNDGDEKTLEKVYRYNRNDVKEGKAVLDRLMKYSGKKKYYGTTTLSD